MHELSAAAIEGCRQLVRIIEATRQRFDRKEPSAEIARALLVDAGFKEDITAGSTSNSVAARRWGNLEGLLNVFARRDDQGKGDRDQFANFLRLLALRQDSEEEEADEEDEPEDVEVPLVVLWSVLTRADRLASVENSAVTELPFLQSDVWVPEPET